MSTMQPNWIYSFVVSGWTSFPRYDGITAVAKLHQNFGGSLIFSTPTISLADIMLLKPMEGEGNHSVWHSPIVPHRPQKVGFSSRFIPWTPPNLDLYDHCSLKTIVTLKRKFLPPLLSIISLSPITSSTQTGRIYPRWPEVNLIA